MNVVIILLWMLLGIAAHAQEIKFGLDNLIDTEFSLLQGKRIALLTHAAARSYRGLSCLDEFQQQKAATIVRVFSPEHGYYGVVPAGEHVLNDTVQGVAVQSLYGKYRKPDSLMLSGVDAVVIDLQDIGVRSYTYISTIVEVLSACAEYNKLVYVLDRPNPLGGLIVSGNIPHDSLRSFVCRVPVPYVHGLTVGELSTMANACGWLQNNTNIHTELRAKLTVVRMKRWRRSLAWEDINRVWYPTSPNIPTITSARSYAVTGLCGELGAFNIGIGTPLPFSLLIAPNFFPQAMLRTRLLTFGISAMDFSTIPAIGKFSGKQCTGYYLACAKDTSFRPFEAACALVSYTAEYAGIATDSTFDMKRMAMFTKVMGSEIPLRLIQTRAPLSEWYFFASSGKEAFLEKRKPYLFYEN